MEEVSCVWTVMVVACPETNLASTACAFETEQRCYTVLATLPDMSWALDAKRTVQTVQVAQIDSAFYAVLFHIHTYVCTATSRVRLYVCTYAQMHKYTLLLSKLPS